MAKSFGEAMLDAAKGRSSDKVRVEDTLAAMKGFIEEQLGPREREVKEVWDSTGAVVAHATLDRGWDGEVKGVRIYVDGAKGRIVIRGIAPPQDGALDRELEMVRGVIEHMARGGTVEQDSIERERDWSQVAYEAVLTVFFPIELESKFIFPKATGEMKEVRVMPDYLKTPLKTLKDNPKKRRRAIELD